MDDRSRLTSQIYRFMNEWHDPIGLIHSFH